MKEDQEQKCHVCRFCKQGFSNGKKLGGHMRRHLALIASFRTKGAPVNNQETINGEKGVHVCNNDDNGGRKQSVQENDQEIINGEKSLDFDDGLVKKSQQEHDSGGNKYVLRDNPKKTWRVSNSTEDYVPSRTKSMKDTVCKKQSIQENDQDIINGEKGLGFDDVMVNKSQQEHDSSANEYVFSDNPKRFWRVLNSSKDCDPSRTDSMKKSVCKKCGKGFYSVKALYGHMRCHSIKRSRPFDGSSLLSSSVDVHEDGVTNPVRNKRQCSRYKSVKRRRFTSLNCDDEVEKGAICLMMLSRGVRDLGAVAFVVSMEYHSKSKEDLIVKSGSGQMCELVV